MDVIEIDAATNRGIDEIRELRDAARYRPARDRYKIWILDEAHQITDAAFNALLKTLEEPPVAHDFHDGDHAAGRHSADHSLALPALQLSCRQLRRHRRPTSRHRQARRHQADDDALAMLAEAGDGSMRDALSIMDQAIACCGDTLSADVVRGLVGTVGSDILEDVMDAVARNSSEDVLRTIDRLLVEGQSAQHFARQMVRFLRNALVAKVAGSDSPVLQISSDERARVARVAERFSEEDLTRFLQIMLRTHTDLGYKQEQRFHLELGLLKLVHAQRLLPLEQLLSGEAAQAGRGSCAGELRVQLAARSPARDAQRGSASAHEHAALNRPRRAAAASPFKGPSPFEADRSRKSEPKAEAPPADRPRATRRASDSSIGDPDASCCNASSLSAAVAVAVETSRPSTAGEVTPESLRNAVLAALEDAGQQMLAHNLESGEWSVRGHEVSVKVAMSQVMVDVALGDGPKRIVQDALPRPRAEPMKFKMVSGGAQFAPKPAPPSSASSERRRRAQPRRCPTRSCSACRKNSARKFAPSSTTKGYAVVARQA